VNRRRTDAALARLAELIERMDALGHDAGDAAARINQAIAILGMTPAHQELAAAIGDLIDIITERSRLAHDLHRLITEIRQRDLPEPRITAADPA
jgi:hypothetical protein